MNMDLKNEIIKILKKHVKGEIILEIPPELNLGDYALPCFGMAKELKKSPNKIAEELKSKLKLSEHIEKIEAKGPYLNFYVNKSFLAKHTLSKVKDEKDKYGAGKNKGNVVVEYCGPNTNKPLHLGHIRNMALGYSICRILKFTGSKIHPVNIVNDRGIHICQSMLAYKKWGGNKKPEKKGDHFVGDYYVMFSKESEKNEKLKLEVHELLLKWEQGDKETVDLWKKMNKWVLDGFKETYKRFGVIFEKEYFESEYYTKGKEIVMGGYEKNIFEKDHTDAIIARLEKYNLPDKVLLRGDETSIYITQDIYLAKLRYDDFKFDKLIYVVASEQNLHFKQLFKILELLKRPYAKKMHHLSYGMVNLPSGRMKSREGTVVDADDIMDETASLTEDEIKKRHKNLSAKEIKARSEIISLAAIKFYMLKNDPIKDIVFNPEESLNFEGETGPYIQYAHARACSILKKVEFEKTAKTATTEKSTINYGLLKHQKEEQLIRLIYTFPEKVEESALHYKPSIICHYLLALAQAFNEFYHECHVISDDKEMTNTRLILVDCARQVLDNGLSLLGITAPQEM